MSPLLRLIILAGVGPLLTLHFFVPLIWTFLPIWREERRISWELAGRLLLRGALVGLIAIQIVFVLEEIQPGTFALEVFRWGRTIAWTIAGAGAVVSWLTHPHGMRGL